MQAQERINDMCDRNTKQRVTSHAIPGSEYDLRGKIGKMWRNV